MKKEIWIAVLLVIICALAGFENPRFLSEQNLRNVARLVGMYGIFSIGMGIIIITGGIDLSVGSLFALQGVLLSMMLEQWNWPWPIATAAAILGVMALGAFHGFLIAEVKLQPFIVTLCGLLAYRGLARVVAHDETKGFSTHSVGFLKPLATGSLGPVPMPFVMLLVVALIMWVVLHHSVYGRYLYAVGRNEEAARYSGVNTKLVIGSVYVVSMILVGISGILFAFYTNSISPSTHGTFYELFGIAAAVLGGCSLRGGEGSILGILLGTILLQVLQNLVTLLHFQSSWTYVVLGAVILIGVTADELLGRHIRSRGKATGAGG